MLFFDQSVKNKQKKKPFEDMIEIADGNDVIVGCLLDYSYFNEH